ncbi:hypothetical protein AGOR_G00080370 [Albula goreensis]|uniref:Uncharacterized protein n=1 Tax=Albula goreensis TaxID=1534307 RepID=A0A8T3DIQ3_9TELE|nr:hypothetical protein AGOR_G00080370 [Albula goreensis]
MSCGNKESFKLNAVDFVKLILSYITTTEHKTTKKIMADSNSIANLNKGMKKTYRAQDVREETELKMRSYANWGEFLVPGPLSIAILGELVFISANTDFAINRFTPDKKYTYIKHPESFRACLMQVCNDGWKAFNTAHTNMDKIRLLSLGIPNDVKNVVQTLMQEDQKCGVTASCSAGKMKGVSSKCFDLAKHVEGDFQKLIDLISELLENCTSAKSAHQEALKEAKQAIEFTELKRQSAERAKKMAEEYHTMVSSQYLMDGISNLGTLMSLEPDNPEFKRARLELQGSCEEAQKGILELVEKNRDDFDERIEKRIDTINQNLKAVLPAPSREEQKAIEDTVRKDPNLQLKEISKEDEDEFV